MFFTNRTITAYVFNNGGGQQGLVDNYWSIQTTSLMIKPNTEYNFALTNRIMKRQNLKGNCMPDDEVLQRGYNYIKCIELFTVNNLRQSGQKLCWIPQADFFIKQMNDTSIGACQTREDFEGMEDLMQSVMSKTERRIPSCPQPCTTDHISLTQKENPFFGNSNQTVLYFYWDNLDVLVEEEYLLMDWNAIVAAIGGSLGLFLGFSCLDFLLKFLSQIELMCFEKSTEPGQLNKPLKRGPKLSSKNLRLNK